MAERKKKREIPAVPLADRNLVKALAHTLRQKILFLMVAPPPPETEEEKAKAAKGEWNPEPPPWSPNGLSQELDEALGNVSYHVKTLLEYECVELVKTEPRRGAVEHFYRPTPEAKMRLAALASIGPELGAQDA